MTDARVDGSPSPELYSLVYASFAAQPFSDDALATLLDESRRANAAEDITGILLYRDGRFIQFLEGPRDRVASLFARISQDTRHRGVRVMSEGSSSSRQFAAWTMGYEPVREPTDPLPEGFRSTFDDLDGADSADSVLRATRELSYWFRVRSAAGE